MNTLTQHTAPMESLTHEVKNMTVEELSRLFLADFGGAHAKEGACKSFVNKSMLKAQELYLDGSFKDILNDDHRLLSYRDSFEDREEFNQTLGILQDFQILEKSWESYTLEQRLSTEEESNNSQEISLYDVLGKTPAYATQEQKDLAKSHFEPTFWHQPMQMLEISELIKLAGQVNLETILIEASHTLAELHSTLYKSREAYEAAYKSEAVLAPLCEIMGFDGLAMALRSTVACIELRNTGKGEYVDLAEQILAKHQEGRAEDGSHCHNQLREDVQSIMDNVVGENSHDLVVGSESSHGVVFGDGKCLSAYRDLRLVWRLKSVGSLARKLARDDEDALVKEQRQGYVETPLDIVGITLIAHDRTDLIETYADIFRRMSPYLEEHSAKAPSSTKGPLQPYPAPSRAHSFHVEGDADFVATIKQHFVEQFPEELESISFKTDEKKSFRVAKMTGFYTSKEDVVPFEVQLLTEEDRHTARVGTAAHIFYKLSRQLGYRYIPTEHDIQGLEQINQRKQYLGGEGLCKGSYDRVNGANRRLSAIKAIRKDLGNTAATHYLHLRQ